MARERFGIRAATGLWAAALALTSAVNAAPETIVTVCGTDDAAGGQNLRDALAIGGRILIRCPGAPATIQVTQTRTVTLPTQIDGEGKSILVGPGTQAMFKLGANLSLHALTMRNPLATGVAPGTRTEIAIGAADLMLDRVQTRDTLAPYAVLRFTARDSHFENNGDAAAQSPFVLVDAEFITLQKATFSGNFAHPLGGGQFATSGRAPLSRQVLIEDSSFTRNSFPVLVQDGVLTIRRSSFASNGSPPDKAGGAWGCCAGALMVVQSRTTITDSEFSGNASAGFGGAISAVGSEVRIARTLFTQNAARAGGAIAYWGHLPGSNVWSSSPTGLRPQLRLDRARFRDNLATFDGGAILWAGALAGDATLFVGNHARRGGAIAHVGALRDLPAEYADVLAGIESIAPGAVETMDLARAAFFENEAQVEGGGVDGWTAFVTLGDALIARNRVTKAGGATLFGINVALANSTLVQNSSAGIRLDGTVGKLALANTIVAHNNGPACDVAQSQISASIPNLQFPGGSCGSSITSQSPELDENYAPLNSSPARTSGNIGTCVSHPLVAGVDLNGKPRGNSGVCAMGAIEPAPTVVQQVMGTVTPSHHDGRDMWFYLFWILLLIFVLLGIFFGWRHVARCRARKKSTA